MYHPTTVEKISVKHSARKPRPHVSHLHEELLEESLQSLTVTCLVLSPVANRLATELGLRVGHYLTSKARKYSQSYS